MRSKRSGRTGEDGPLRVLLTSVPVLATAAGLAVAACGEASSGSAPSGPFVVRDSAGVRIVGADWDRLAVLDTVEAAPEFTIGEDDTLPLDRVRAGRLLPGGRIAVGFGTSPRVVVVDTAGGEVTTVAEAGEGPAEVRSVAGLHVEAGGERLGVYDPAGRRYLIFTLDGELTEERVLRGFWPDEGGPAVRLWGPPAFLPVGDGTFYLGARAGPPRAEGTSRAELPLIRVRGSRVDTVTRYRGMEFFGRGRNTGPVLLGARVAFAASPAGVWVGDTESPSVARWSGPGAPEQIVRWSRDADRTLTEGEVRALLDRLMEQIPEHQRQDARRYAERLPVPDRYPAFGDLLADEGGLLWVGEHYGVDFPQIRLLPAEPRSWALFAPDGTPVGRVITPPRTNLLDVRGNRFLGLHQDELGVETVRLYRLER